jgi:hypothetical protein
MKILIFLASLSLCTLGSPCFRVVLWNNSRRKHNRGLPMDRAHGSRANRRFVRFHGNTMYLRGASCSCFAASSNTTSTSCCDRGDLALNERPWLIPKFEHKPTNLDVIADVLWIVPSDYSVRRDATWKCSTTSSPMRNDGHAIFFILPSKKQRQGY